MWVVVPVKRFSNAKTRLAPLLSAAERESLAQAMLNDVLRAIAEIDPPRMSSRVTGRLRQTLAGDLDAEIGREALAILQEHKEDISLILLDIVESDL